MNNRLYCFLFHKLQNKSFCPHKTNFKYIELKAIISNSLSGKRTDCSNCLRSCKDNNTIATLINCSNFMPFIDDKVLYDCPKCKECCALTNSPYRLYLDCNTVVNTFPDGKLEIICYKKNFAVLKDSLNLVGQNNERKFKKVDTEIDGMLLLPTSPYYTYNDLQESINTGSVRAMDNYYSFALSNKWQFFATFTVDRKKCDRYNDEEVKQLWQLFRYRLYQYDKHCKYICVPERHEDGALHFHALISLSIPPPTLHLHIVKGKQQYSRTGAPLFTFDLWNFGICTLAVLPEEGNQSAVINYLIQYTTKQNNLGYGCRRFMRTQNLEHKEKEVIFTENAEKMAQENGLTLYKENEIMNVWRNFNIKGKI